MIAYSLFVSNEVTLYTFANPPFPKSFPRKYLCTVYPSPQGLFLCSTIVTGSEEDNDLDSFEAVLDERARFCFDEDDEVDGMADGTDCPISTLVLKSDELITLRRVSLDKLLIALLLSFTDDSTEENDGFLSKVLERRESFLVMEGMDDLAEAAAAAEEAFSTLTLLCPKGLLPSAARVVMMDCGVM